MDQTGSMSQEELIRHYELLLKEKNAELWKCKTEISEKNGELARLRVQHQDMTWTLSSLEEETLKLRDEICQKERIILDQEQKIQLYMKTASDSDRTVQELRETVESVEKENWKLTRKDKEMTKEFLKLKSDQDLKILEMSRRLSWTWKENRKETQRVNYLEVLVSRFQSDLHRCLGFIQEPKQLKREVTDLYERYVRQGSKLDIRTFDEDAKFVQHSELLQKIIVTLKRELAGQRAAHQAEKNRIIKENMVLMQENNELRAEIKRLHAEVLGGRCQKAANVERKVQTPCSGKKPVKKDEDEEEVFMLPFVHIKKLEERPGRIEPLRLPPSALQTPPKSTIHHLSSLSLC